MLERVAPSQALARKYPEWIDLVVARSANGQINAMPVGWSMIASGSPLLYAVAIHRRQYTAQLIREMREFVVAAPSADMAEATLYCGTHSGRDGDKIEPSGLKLAPSAEIETPLLEGAVYNLECRLHSEFETGDHILFVGEVVAAHLDKDTGERMMNFGGDDWACAQIVQETKFQR
jgi:flavin reductase (DIM6/NTAB) family NADH-FMN oxidoreductase RutF